jgi:hypothetical protein
MTLLCLACAERPNCDWRCPTPIAGHSTQSAVPNPTHSTFFSPFFDHGACYVGHRLPSQACEARLGLPEAAHDIGLFATLLREGCQSVFSRGREHWHCLAGRVLGPLAFGVGVVF